MMGVGNIHEKHRKHCNIPHSNNTTMAAHQAEILGNDINHQLIWYAAV
jgi:hypothetical protein